MKWHHRTIKHIHSTTPDCEVYYTVHEFYFSENVKGEPVYMGFTASPAHSCSRHEDDSYATYAWLVHHSPDSRATDPKEMRHAAST